MSPSASIRFGIASATVVIAALAPAGALAQESPAPSTAGAEASPMPVDVPVVAIATGLTNPRGFAWAPDGSLTLALAGHGGDTVIPAAEGFTVHIGLSSSVATLGEDGCTTPIVQGLVSTAWEQTGWIWGAMDVAYLDDALYVLLSGAGPTWLSPSSFSGVFRVNDDGTMDLVADLTTWIADNPPANLPLDYNSDGSLFDLEAAGDALLLTEAVGGQLIRVTPEGEITRVADLSEGHLVPTGIAVDDEGNAFVGFETADPYGDGASKVVQVTPGGTVTDAWTGLTVVTDVALGPDGVLYAAEMATGFTEGDPSFPPDSGRVVRQSGPDSSEEVMTGLPAPAYLGFDASGRLLVTAPAFAADAGVGHGMVLSFDMTQAPLAYDGPGAEVTCPAA
jgi:hypothetical protein